MMIKKILLLGALMLSLAACNLTNKNAHPLQSLQDVPQNYEAFKAPPIKDWATAEGAKVLFIESSGVPMFDVRVIFAAGSVRDGNQHGLAHLTNAMLGEGTSTKDANKIADEFAMLGAQFSTSARRDMAVASLRSISELSTRTKAVQLFAQVIGRPSFPVSSLVRIKNQTLTSFKHKEQLPAVLANEEMFKVLYDDHPYAHAPSGNKTSVEPLSRKSLMAFHKSAYSANNATIAIVGDLSLNEAKEVAAQISAALPNSQSLGDIPPPKERLAVQRHIGFKGGQSHIVLASLGIDRNHPNYAALMLGNHILGGGGFGSRLMTELREKRGITYGVYSNFAPMAVRGPFQIELQTSAKYTQGAIALIKQIVDDFVQFGPTDAEFESAKNEMLNSFALGLGSNSDMVRQLGMIGFYKLPFNFMGNYQTQIKNLSREQVIEALKRHLAVEKLAVITVGPKVKQQVLPPAAN